MTLSLKLIFITVILVFAIDLSGFVDSIKVLIARVLTKHGRPTAPENIRLKPFDCSLCMTFWVGLIYIILSGNFSLKWIAAVCIAALLTVPVLDAYHTLLDALAALFRWINKRLN